jgi:hypothetical protein
MSGRGKTAEREQRASNSPINKGVGRIPQPVSRCPVFTPFRSNDKYGEKEYNAQSQLLKEGIQPISETGGRQ